MIMFTYRRLSLFTIHDLRRHEPTCSDRRRAYHLERPALFIIAATGFYRAGRTEGRVGLAELLSVTAQKLMYRNQPVEVLLQLVVDRLLRRSIGRGVVLSLFAMPEPQQHSEPVRIQCEDLMSLREEQYSLRTWIADAGKLLQ